MKNLWEICCCLFIWMNNRNWQTLLTHIIVRLPWINWVNLLRLRCNILYFDFTDIYIYSYILYSNGKNNIKLNLIVINKFVFFTSHLSQVWNLYLIFLYNDFLFREFLFVFFSFQCFNLFWSKIIHFGQRTFFSSSFDSRNSNLCPHYTILMIHSK